MELPRENHFKTGRTITPIGLLALLTLSLMLTGSVPPAGSSSASTSDKLQPLSTFSTAAPTGLGSYIDTCSVAQPASDRIAHSVYDVSLRGGASMILEAPSGWTCGIQDAYGSGGGVSIASNGNEPGYVLTKGSIHIDATATISDSGLNFCPYSTYFDKDYAYPPNYCKLNSARPKGEEVRYLYGGSTSSRAIVLVADPPDTKTPAGVTSKYATVTVLAASGQSGTASMICSIGTTLSQDCISDAYGFAAGVEKGPHFPSGTFSPIAHKAALLKVLDADVAKGEKINRLTIKPSPINPAWVYYTAGIPVRASNGTTEEDLAEGFAHWVNGKWVVVYGPWSVSCGPLKSLTKIPKAIRNSFILICK
jgi:hypothetical protein